MITMKKIILLTLICLVKLSYGATPVFTAAFEENFLGLHNGKTLEGKVSQQLLWETLQNMLQPGLKGTAAVIGTSSDKEKVYHAIYNNKNNVLNPIAGTIAFCVKPVNWNGQDKDFKVMFQATGSDSTLLIYKYINSSNLMFLLGPSRPINGKYLWSMAGTNIKKWKAGVWHHITATYDEKFIELYIDGKQVSKVKRLALPKKSFTQFSVGAIAPKQWKGNPGLSLIDEVEIFNKKLSINEIAKLAAKFVKQEKPQISNVATIVDRKNKIVNLYFTIEGIADNCTVSFIDSNKKVIFSKEITKLVAQNKIPFSLKNLLPGKYTISIKGLSNKQITCQKDIIFVIPKLPEEWKNNSLGISEKVIAPWSNLKKQQNNTISGATFTYNFGESFLPQQITANKEALFNRPAQLLLNGKNLALKSKITQLSSTGNKNIFTSTSQNNTLKISATVETLFDGFTWVKLILEPKTNLTIDSLKLEFPFKKQSSTLFNSMNKFYMNYQPGHCGKFKNYSMNLYKRPPIMFVGNDDCGMQWFCEELSYWYNKDKDKSLELISKTNENILQLKLIDHKVQIKNKLVYEFGFQSVPIRPMPKNWRTLSPYINFDPYFVWSKYHHYPYVSALRTDAAYAKLKKDKTARFGKNLFYYFAGFTITPTFPEWPYYSSEWMLTPPELGLYGAPKNPAAYFTWICPNSKEYQDFYLDRFNKIIKTLNISNIYIDNSDAQLCDNSRHNCGYINTDGKRYSSFNLRATRRLAKRVYTLLKEHSPNGRVIRHMSAKPVAPVIAFADMIVDGELYNKTVALDESYFNIFKPDMFRASFVGKLWGMPQFFIPQFTRVIPWHNPTRYAAWKTPQAREKQKDKIRHFKGYFLVHDTQIFQLFGVRVHDVEKLKRQFNLRNESTFISYSSSNKPWKSNPSVLVSGYIDNGKLLLILMNTGKSNKVSIQLDKVKLQKLGVKKLALTNAETGKTVTVNSNTIDLSLLPNDYAILWNI